MRTRVLALILFLWLGYILFGLTYVQIGLHERMKVMSEENRLKVVPLMAPRGSITDRNGEVLVKDVLSFNVSVLYSRIKDKSRLASTLSSVLDVPEAEMTEKIEKSRRRPFNHVVLAEDIGIEKAVHLEEIEMDFPGLLIDVSAKREYPKGKTASNLLGYLGLINRTEFEKLKHYGYSISDVIGRSGIEKQYDNYLRGRHGGKQVEVDHRGRQVSTLGYKEPVPGRNLRSTIDLELQSFCDDLLEDKRGAIVAMDPSSGEVLAMASAPSFDPGIFVDRKRSEEVSEVLNDNEYPLLNRAITGAYPPGSVFKVVTAAAALETGSVTPERSFYCPGSMTLGNRTFRCWKESGHGEQDLRRAIKNSCNVYFWRAGLLVGVDSIAEYGSLMGLGDTTGIDLPGESGGVLPSREWKRERLNKQWYRGETLNYAIGQGYLLCTPLQLARMMSVFANGGYLVEPYVVDSIGDVKVNIPEKKPLGISDASVEQIRAGLRDVVNHPRGTGMKARSDKVVISGKTGTAQTSRGKNHGWFGGFAPYEEARLTVVVFDEYGGKGGYYAAGTAGKVFEKARELGLLGEEYVDSAGESGS
ncbi:MAG: penicillin-binding protein 2 [Candidatus Omnitrophica bacterium]|nr:penicillin-binding protein 2 [Candidatus Omnitrophota bacterium]